MYPLTYYETFMRYEANNEVFVAMPFTKAFKRAYETVIAPAIEHVMVDGKKLQPRIINRGTTGSPDIHEQIFDAIIHSRMVIADMTVQSMYTNDDNKVQWHPNPNVAYEVGLACAWRNPEDILLVHQVNKEHTYSFDIQNLRHVPYEAENPDSVRQLVDEIVRAISQSRFLANQTYLKIIQSLSPSAIQYMNQESRRVFPAVSFPDEQKMPMMDCRVHAVTELLSYGALKNRNVIPQGNGKGVAVVYQWTELGLRMMLSIHAINQARKKELSDKIASVPEDKIPSQELMTFPNAEVVPSTLKAEAAQEVKEKG